MTLFLTRKRAADEAARALIRNRRATDCRVSLARQRNDDGSIDYGFRVDLIDASRNRIATL